MRCYLIGNVGKYVNTHEMWTNKYWVSIYVNITFSEVLIHYSYAYSSQLSGDTWFAVVWMRTLATVDDNV